ncbi:MAG TPA: hypothetical protein VLB10_00730 [Gammaproteobacteria bacterium]|jgi:hypothetical protein|nr:hypothetical protein [Gammaproteobacteria bacterium]
MPGKTKIATVLVAAVTSAPLVTLPAHAGGTAKSNQFRRPGLLDLEQLRSYDAR